MKKKAPLLRRLFFFSSLTALLFFILAIAVMVYVGRRPLPDLSKSPPMSLTTKVYAADSSLLTTFYAEQDRTVIPLEKIAPFLQEAVVAVEDERFWEHKGFDLIGVLRALWTDLFSGKPDQGGSTITQQLIKNLYGEKEKTLSRKARELLLASELESRWNKRQILEKYLNVVYFGADTYGVETASKKFFGKNPDKLALEEAALLAGIIRSPIQNSPYTKKKNALQRRNFVIRKMRHMGYITKAEARAAELRPIRVLKHQKPKHVALYFEEHVKQTLIKQYGADKVFKGGLKIYTTIDPKLQQLAELSIAQHLPDKKDPWTAIVAVDPSNGFIKALVGGKDFNQLQFNLATQGRRQPGSAFKTFALIAALENGHKLDSWWDSSPAELPVPKKDEIWKVANYEGQGKGLITLWAASVYSVNTAYARLIMKLGTDKLIKTARKMGIESPLREDPAIVLGGLEYGVSPLEMASAYAVIASGGNYRKPTAISRIETANGEILYKWKDAPKKVLSRSIALLVHSVLKDVVQIGTGKRAAQAAPVVAGKTGTTQKWRDAWFVGYTPELSAAVWVGYPQAQISMENIHGIPVSGGSFPTQIWASFIKSAQNLSKRETNGTAEEPAPEVQRKVKLCTITWKLATPNCPDTTEIALESRSMPTEYCDLHNGNLEILAPDFTGAPIYDAQERLSKLGIKPRIEYRTVKESLREGYIDGEIISQEPKPGESLKPGASMKLWVVK